MMLKATIYNFSTRHNFILVYGRPYARIFKQGSQNAKFYLISQNVGCPRLFIPLQKSEI